MTDVERLVAEATPLPWAVSKQRMKGSGSDQAATVADLRYRNGEADGALIEYAVNRLLAYEAAVEALERLLEDAEMARLQSLNLGPLIRTQPEVKGTPMALTIRLDESTSAARVALSRLRERVVPSGDIATSEGDAP